MPKKTPQRTCMGCQAKKDKRELVRIVRSPEGEISVDADWQKTGQRGVYLSRYRMLKQSGKEQTSGTQPGNFDFAGNL